MVGLLTIIAESMIYSLKLIPLSTDVSPKQKYRTWYDHF